MGLDSHALTRVFFFFNFLFGNNSKLTESGKSKNSTGLPYTICPLATSDPVRVLVRAACRHVVWPHSVRGRLGLLPRYPFLPGLAGKAEGPRPWARWCGSTTCSPGPGSDGGAARLASACSFGKARPGHSGRTRERVQRRDPHVLAKLRGRAGAPESRRLETSRSFLLVYALPCPVLFPFTRPLLVRAYFSWLCRLLLSSVGVLMPGSPRKVPQSHPLVLFLLLRVAEEAESRGEERRQKNLPPSKPTGGPEAGGPREGPGCVVCSLLGLLSEKRLPPHTHTPRLLVWVFPCLCVFITALRSLLLRGPVSVPLHVRRESVF